MLEDDRFGDELDRAAPQARLGLGLACDPGYDDNGDSGVPDLPLVKEVKPVHAGESEVEQDQIGTVLLEPVERTFGGEDELRLVAELEEKVLQDGAHRPVIFDDQDPHTGISTARGIPEASGHIRRNIRSLPRRCERQKVEISVAFEWARYARDGGRPVSFLPDVRRRERSEEHTSELQSLTNLVCRLLLEKKKQKNYQ